MRRIPVSVIAFVLCSILTGCTTFTIKVDSINSGDTGKKSYVIYSGIKDVETEDLQFKEFARYTENALRIKGFTPANDIDQADLAIFLFYSISDPTEHEYSYSLPVYGQTGVSSKRTSGSVSVYGNSASYSENTTYTPTYGVTGYTQHSGTRTTFTRFISIEAIDLKHYRETEKQKQVWRTEIVSTGSSGDLREVFPVMMGAATKYLSENTGKKVTVDLSETDSRVKRVKASAY